MADINLKPCPFCGGDADISHDHTVEENHACGCRICGIWFDTFNSDEAAEAWNTRAAIAAMTPTPQRCAECDCENGGDECTWIAPAKSAMTPQEAAPDWEGFGRAMLEHWPVRDVDGAELFGLSLEYGLIAEVPGGYDPEQHIDAEGISPEKGDPWYEYTFRAISEDSHE
ncbi:MAG: Lar family restriction alleviation protein [Sulfitobacter sp.]